MKPSRRRCRHRGPTTTDTVPHVDPARIRRLHQLINEIKASHGLDYPTDVFGMVANLPADQITGDQRWMLDQITGDYRVSAATLWRRQTEADPIPTPPPGGMPSDFSDGSGPERTASRIVSLPKASDLSTPRRAP